MTQPSADTNFETATEQELRECRAPSPETFGQLEAAIHALVDREHTYGTCVYAMSIAATAAFNYVAHKLGVTGFQASCADLDILKRTRHMDRFRVVDMGDLLYPQYRDKFDELRFESLIQENAEWLSKAATEKLAEAGDLAHPEVLTHWRRLADLPSAVPSSNQE